MKFALGYQLPEEGEEPFVEIVKDFRESVEEVYFPWLDMPSGRSPMTRRDGFVEWDAQQRLEEDLKEIKAMGIKIDLLLNANCYGKDSLSLHFKNLICSIIAHLKEKTGLDVVTTTSLMIARTIKDNFPEIDIRASVNMRIGTIKAMEYVADLFDSFYIQREYNRDFQRIAEIKKWTDKQKKGLYILVNSGCLNFCSGQVFHDNLVAHESEIGQMKNVEGWNPSICWNYYKKKENWVTFLQNSWIRPEDLDNYNTYFSMAKLATRMHSNPRKVIQAYAEKKYNGNLLDLLEPGYGPLFFPYIIDNAKFLENWFEKTITCDKNCHQCNYCSQVLGKVLLKKD
ncbi:MAG: hypothetical protein BWK74_07310 [Desulfobacteraceae bacterium A6]|nr:MAG: hypothetical protein BWK74_07310 [Desulfobacteraceae bacterium A6]